MRSSTARAVTVALAATICLPALAPAQRTDETRSLEIKIRQTLVERLGDDARTIQVAINGRKAFLSGTVEERVTQELAKEVVLTFAEVAGATNRIEARNSPHLSEGQAFLEGQDAELEMQVRRAVAKALGAQSKALQIEVVDRVVSVRGTLPDADRKELALVTVKNVGKVRDVLDLVRTAR